MPIHPEAAAHADTPPPGAAERYTPAQLYAHLLREPPEQAQRVLANLQESAAAGWTCREQDHALAVLMIPRLTRQRYDRAILVDVVTHHWPTATSGCGCGWARLGASHPGHVADMYEQTIAALEA